MSQYDYMIGTTALNMVNLETLFAANRGTFTAHADPVDYAKIVQLGDGSQRGLGWLQTQWHFDYLSLTHYALLKAYCSGLSASVYIKTRKNDGTFGVYTARMLWPEQEPERGSSAIVLDINIKFIQLVEVV
jgi:hypothetical protein